MSGTGQYRHRDGEKVVTVSRVMGLLTGIVLAIWLAASARAGGEDEAILRLLHEGRFAEAQTRADRWAEAEPSPRTEFFRAFPLYWRLLYEEDAPALQGRFEARLRDTIASGARCLAQSPADRSPHLWVGTAHLLLGQLEGARDRPMGAAFEAKKARRALEQAKPGPDALDALWGLGAYDVLADSLPAAARPLRALLSLPAGDRARGLARLERAARESPHFALEARLLLMTLHMKKSGRRSEALRHARALADREEASLAARYGAGRVLVRLGRIAEADALLAGAEERAREPGVDPVVLAALRLERARAQLADLRPDRALEQLEPLLSPPATVPATLRDEARGLQAEAAGLAALPPFRAATAPAPDGTLCQPSAPEPGDPVVALMSGRCLMQARRAAEASTLLAGAARDTRLPEPWKGPARLLAGQAADAAGDRSGALDWYRKALESPAFPAREAARLHLEVAYRAE